MKIYPESEQVSAVVKHIVDYMIMHGTENTTSGNYIFTVDELSEIFKLDSSFIINHEVDILNELYTRDEILGEIWMERDSDFVIESFDLNFGTDYCPNLDDEPLTPKEFAEQMRMIDMSSGYVVHLDGSSGEGERYKRMIDVITELLTDLGYGEGIDIFNATTKHSEDIDVYNLLLESNKLM